MRDMRKAWGGVLVRKVGKRKLLVLKKLLVVGGDSWKESGIMVRAGSSFLKWKEKQACETHGYQISGS